VLKTKKLLVLTFAVFFCALFLRGATPEDFKKKAGVYVWGQLRGGLTVAVDDANRLGANQVARVAISPAYWWDPIDPNDNRPIDQKVQRADYQYFLKSFPVTIWTAYDSASAGLYKNGDATIAGMATNLFRGMAFLSRPPRRSSSGKCCDKRYKPGA